jgi:hypothetical protein
MPTGQQYATNVPQTTLVAGITSGQTVFTVASSAGWPAAPFTAVLQLGESLQEPIDVTNVAGASWTVTRAIDSTTPLAHAANATVTHGDIGRDFREARAHMDTGVAQHGLTGGSSIVGTLDTQTLSQKTLVAPIITGTTTASGNIDINSAGSGLQVAEGANARQGTSVLVAGTVVVSNTSVTAFTRIFLTSQVDGGTPGFLRVSTRAAGTSFTILSSSNTDTSTVAWELIEKG